MRVESSLSINEQAKVSLKQNVKVEETPQHIQGKADAAAKDTGKGQDEKAEKSITQLLLENCELDFQLNFSIHKETNRLTCKVVDPDSNEVIREIPPEELLELAVRLQEMLGILVDKRI